MEQFEENNTKSRNKPAGTQTSIFNTAPSPVIYPTSYNLKPKFSSLKSRLKMSVNTDPGVCIYSYIYFGSKYK